MVGEVQDFSDEDNGDESEQPVRLFANVGEPALDQDLGDGNPLLYQADPRADSGNARPGGGYDQSNTIRLHYQPPNLQSLQPIPPEQLREAGYIAGGRGVTEGEIEGKEIGGERTIVGEEESEEEQTKGEKTKKEAKLEKERKKWKEKQRQLEKQIQQQRQQCRQQRVFTKSDGETDRHNSNMWSYVPPMENTIYGGPECPVNPSDNASGPEKKRTSSATTAKTAAYEIPQSRFQWQPQQQQWAPPPQQRPPGQGQWVQAQSWQPAAPQGEWVWKQPEQPEIAKAKKRGNRLALSEESENSEEEAEEREKKKKDKEKNWERETAKQRNARHRKYEKMSETTDSDKQSVKHQVAAMYKSVISQEKIVKHLRSLYYKDSTEEQMQENRDLLEEVLTARKELVERITYLEVAFDYDWEAAKVFLEMREANPSSIVLKAVTEAKKRKAASKEGKETEEKKKKKPDANNNSSSSNSVHWRGSNFQRPYAQPPVLSYWAPSPQQQPPPFYGYANPYPPASPYGRQASSGFRPTRPPGCFTCGEANHGFRRCPNASGPPPPPPPGKPPLPPT